MKIAKLVFPSCVYAGVLAMIFGARPCAAQQAVSAQVQMIGQDKSVDSKGRASADVVVWLKALDNATQTPDPAPKRQRLVQFHKTFEPHLLVVQTGSTVDFPNRDPFFHNVFSLFEGKRFDLGLYEAGVTNSVRFDRVGVSFLFCNIHPEMSAVVVSVDTPFYGVSDRNGKVTIANVPNGRYEIHYWSERALPESLKPLTRTIAISSSERNLPAVQIAENPNFTLLHKNKYGQDYVPAPNSDYPHP